MTREDLLARVATDPALCAGMACIRDTRICVAVILDALAEGLTAEEVLEHFPSLEAADVRAAAACAAELARENLWKVRS
jgi:uncharacterized protein (DUF433 family)